jgi:type I restriction enzyme M protein
LHPGHRRAASSEVANFLWSIADLLRGTYKQADYGKVILPMTVLRRLDCVLEPTRAKVLAKAEAMKGRQGQGAEPRPGPEPHHGRYFRNGSKPRTF